jgi:acyl-CoA reductase-like NAD-dependent aldehyde dehydrogenase
MKTTHPVIDVPLKSPDRLFIGGEWIPAVGNTTIEVIAPATERLYTSVAEAKEEDIERAVAAARAAFDQGPWPHMSHTERAAYLFAIGEELDRRAADIASIWPNEMGIVHSTARAYVAGLGGIYRAYAAMAGTFSFEREHRTTSGAKLGLLVREPVGVVGAIIPWNGPMPLIATKLAPALLAGCTIVIKASPEAPGQALLMGEIAEAVGLPKGVVNVLTADRSASAALVRHPGVDKIAFTGSTAAGKVIASQLGNRMARYTMELGGKFAALVLDDYDLETAAQAITANACRMTGQVCACVTRIIVSRERHDAMLEALAAHFAAVRIGDPFEEQTQMGPLATARQRDKVEGYIRGAERDGFTLAAGGRRPSKLTRGYYIEPTLFGHVDNRSILAQEEVFGPVVSVIPARDETEAISMANDSRYGLSGAVFTNDVDHAYVVSRKLRTGNVSHNAIRADFGIAFGGFKDSGIGREGGEEGLFPYLEAKTILLAATPSHRGSPQAVPSLEQGAAERH